MQYFCLQVGIEPVRWKGLLGLHFCHPSRFIAAIFAVWFNISSTHKRILAVSPFSHTHPLSLFCCSQGQATGSDVPFGNSLIQHVALWEIPLNRAECMGRARPEASGHNIKPHKHCSRTRSVGPGWSFSAPCGFCLGWIWVTVLEWQRGESRGEEHQGHLEAFFIIIIVGSYYCSNI